MSGSNSKQWVLLAAGSTGWGNYRHQANVCHAYQMVHRNGIPDEQIVVMMYDDIAYNTSNPHKGQIINVPSGPNVYPGVPKDYNGTDVSARNFLAALAGEQVGHGKKVLKSNQDDTIFVFLSDHGAPGVFCFPGQYLYAFDLEDKINEMAAKKKFSKMIIYIESCYSGSMLMNLPENVEVYGVSACMPDQLHYACFYDSLRYTYLSGEFTVCWMNHCDTHDLTKTSFQDQFWYLKNGVTSSTLCEYGNKNTSRVPISELLGSFVRCGLHAVAGKAFSPTDLVPSHEVPLAILKHKIASESDPEQTRSLQEEYEQLCKKKKTTEELIEKIARSSCPTRGPRVLKKRRSLTRLREMKEVAEHFRTTFSHLEEDEHIFALAHMHVFVNLLEMEVEVGRINQAITQARIH